MKRFAPLLTLVPTLCLVLHSQALGQEEGSSYLSGRQSDKLIHDLASKHSELLRLRILAETPGGRDVTLMELGAEDSDLPAILVVANMEANYPIATEAALELSRRLLTEWKDELSTHRWYILPVGNPDGSARYFAKPLFFDPVNERPVNDDNDDAIDEDGPEDLNGDGFITQMRQRHPEGTWMPVADNPVLMKKADRGKGEDGPYRLFSEGIDNDGDGKINEDAPGGVNVGRNFPHNFKHYTRVGGLWAASESETRGLLEFVFDRPEIAMVLSFGRSNSLKDVPASSKKSEAAQDKYKLPKRFAEGMGVSPDKEFPIKELVEMARDYTGYQELTEDMVLMFLGVGAAVNPDKQDLPYWNEISKRYNEFIKEAKLEEKRLKPPGFSSGSVAEWAYYQYGVPSFAMDFWAVPAKKEEKKDEGDKDDEDKLTPDKLETMSNDEFVALGKEKIQAFLKNNDAPPQFTAEMVINALGSGMMTTKKIAEFMKKAKKKDEAGGADEFEDALYANNPESFVAWTPYDHPTLGKVEIGGKIPYAGLTPAASMVSDLLDKQLPFVRELVKLTPKIGIDKVEVKKEASDAWRVNVWIANSGFLPYPTHQGQRCKRPAPAVITIDVGKGSLLEGRARKPLKLLSGSGGTEKATWLVHADEGASVTIKTRSNGAGRDERSVTLSGGGN